MSKANPSRKAPRTDAPSAIPENEYRQTITALQERLQLQELIADISSILINLPTNEVDRQIEQGLERIVAFLKIERSAFGEFSRNLKKLRATHSYAVPGIEPAPRAILNDLFPWYAGKLRRGEIVAIENTAELPAEAIAERAYCQQTGLKSQLTIPIAVGGELLCGIGFAAFLTYRSWPDTLIEQLKRVAEIFAHAIYRKRAEQKMESQLRRLKRSYHEIQQLKDRLQAETDYLKTEIKLNYRHGEIIGESPVIQSVLRRVEQVAPTDTAVLISGETGVGKEVVARAIHNLSSRRKRAMVKVNCASLPSSLVESELFGREKGAYTGAVSRQPGRFEAANGSTIFLDEIGELSLELQAKLLRVLQDGEFERLGSSKTIKVNARIIAATNRDLAEAVRGKNFREDLYYRLKVFPIEVPPLRERPEDIPLAEVLELTRWRVKGKKGAAELLGLKPSTLYSRMEKLGIPNRREMGDM